MTHIDRQLDVTGIDFIRYSEKGSLITPGGYAGDFDPIGMISFTLWPEANKVVPEDRKDEFDPPSARRQVEDLDLQTALDSVHVRATEMGADAVTHFDVRNVSKDYPIELEGIEVSGFLIDRE